MLAMLLAVALGADPVLTVNHQAVSVEALEKLGLQKAQWTEKGVVHVVEGVPMEAVLGSVEPADAGVRPKHASWRQVVLARASDGYSAVFSSGEIAAGLGNTKVLVVTRQDGAPLSGKLGRFRLAVLTDKEPARSIFQLESLEVKVP
jgi:hypothetical protein